MMMKTMMRALLSTALVAVSSTTVAGTAQVGAQTTGQAAVSGDVATLDGIIEALYDVISGPAGEARDWARFHTLFIPEGARLVPSGRGPQGRPGYQVWTPREYMERAGSQLEANGFFEREIGRVTESFGTMVHAFSAYDSRQTLDSEPFARGINSIQLFHDGDRYWIVTVFWDSERPGQEIPPRYLGG